MSQTTKDMYSLTIGWLYPDLMSIYGDRGNIIALSKRCEWRGIGAKVKRITLDSPSTDIKDCDLLFMGGAQDRQQALVSDNLRKKAHTLATLIEEGVPGLYICGAFQFLGKYYKEADGTVIEGLGILDLYTVNPGNSAPRLIGNIAIEASKSFLLDTSFSPYLVGFENHGGRTYLGKNVKPMGVVLKGFGNNGEDGYEGAVYKNSFGSYFHGPILPKNPHFADYLIYTALKKKYSDSTLLTPIDDSLEKSAHDLILKRLHL
jgi:CobQ-like glutamine amidotransferase family enzyme